MHLLGVQIPDFRVLKNVDISFESEFQTRIFPLGSQNGGGKSTLLQLVFILLHCSGVPERTRYLKNLLECSSAKSPSEKTIACLEILHNKKTFRVEFLSYNDSFLRKELSKEADDSVRFSVFSELQDATNLISKLKERISDIEDVRSVSKSVENASDQDMGRAMAEQIQKLERHPSLGELLGLQRNNRPLNGLLDHADILNRLSERLKLDQLTLQKQELHQETLWKVREEINDYLSSKYLVFITEYRVRDDKDEQNALLCRIDGMSSVEITGVLKKLANKVFLSMPPTQVGLFLPQEARKLLFKQPETGKRRYAYQSYDFYLDKAKSELPGFFTYDFIAINSIVELFTAARDKDFQDVLHTGKYGPNYKTLFDSLKALLPSTRLSLNQDLTEVVFETNEGVRLYPEDLSHGELRRLSIYAWLKSKEVQDAIIFIDEIEIAFHPDWEFQIVADLEQWAPDNQYILATHSYELCQALTPHHVKELDPKLLKSKPETVA